MPGFEERLRILIEANSGDAVRGLQATSSAAKSTQGAQSGLTSESGKLRGALNSVGLQGVSTGAALKGAVAGGAVVAGAAMVKFGADSIAATAKLAGEIRNFQRVSGASAEDSSRFVAVLDDMNIESTKGATAMFRLGKEVATGGENLAKYGVEVQRNKDGTADLTGTLLNIADAYSQTKDPAERAALAAAAFGKAGKDLIPILEQGRKGLQDFFADAEKGHQIFSQEDLDNARQYELAMDGLSDAARGFQLQLGNALIPTVTSGAEALTGMLEVVDGVTGKIGGLRTVVEAASGPIAPMIHGWSAFASVLRGDFVNAAEEGIRAIPVLGNVVADLIPGFDDASTAADRMKERQEALSQAVAKVADLADTGRRNTQEYRTAKDEAARAAERLTNEERRQNQAISDAVGSARMAAGALQELTLATMSVHGGNLQLEMSQLKAKQAHDQVATALTAVAEAERNYGAGSAEAAAARDQLTQAQLNAQGADFQVAQTAVQLDATMAKLKEQYHGNVDAIDRQIAALQRSQAAHPGAAAALQVEIDALNLYKASLDDAAKPRKGKFEADGSQAKGEADQVKGKVEGVPKRHDTELRGDASDLRSAAGNAKGAIEDVPKRRDSTLTGDAHDVREAAANARDAIASVPTVHTTRFRAVKEGDWSPSPRQHGGPVAMGRAYVVGEAGPELFVAPSNGEIIPNGAFDSGPGGFAVQPGAAGGDVTIVIVRSEEEALQYTPERARPRARGFLQGRR